MRTRDWRRYKGEQKLITRLKTIHSMRHWHQFIDANDIRSFNPIWVSTIGTWQHYMYKTYTTKPNDSKYKQKYGKKGRGYRGWSSQNKTGTREIDKVKFNRMLENDYGIKHFNIGYGFIQNNTSE